MTDCRLEKKSGGLNRDYIKLIAMGTMTCNHAARAFLESETALYNILIVIGYFTAVVMCYFLVETMHFTKSQTNFGMRLLIFATLSQIPYLMLMFKIRWLEEFSGFHLNMMFTLYLCYFVCLVWYSNYSRPAKWFLYFLLILTSVSCDWAILGPVYTLIFIWVREGEKAVQKKTVADRMTIAALLVGGLLCFNNLDSGIPVAAGCFFVAFFAVMLLKYCYNGKRAAGNPKAWKMFFYIYYPLHMLILGILAIIQ